jgi:hypothetical protein
MNSENGNLTDHDLLIEIRSEVRSVRGDISGVKEGQLDHETRIRVNESAIEQMRGAITGVKWFASAIGFIVVLLEGFFYYQGLHK